MSTIQHQLNYQSEVTYEWKIDSGLPGGKKNTRTKSLIAACEVKNLALPGEAPSFGAVVWFPNHKITEEEMAALKLKKHVNDNRNHYDEFIIMSPATSSPVSFPSAVYKALRWFEIQHVVPSVNKKSVLRPDHTAGDSGIQNSAFRNNKGSSRKNRNRKSGKR